MCLRRGGTTSGMVTRAASNTTRSASAPTCTRPQATYAASTRPSSGIAHVLVGGTFVVRDGELVPDALPGRPVRASAL
jgi:N-acyl-D-aspartate/D-glutamate deacylase